MKKLHLISAALLCLIVASSSMALPGEGIVVKDGQKVAFLGDSITQFGARNPVGYVNLVITGFKVNGLNVISVPAGVSGNTSKDMLARLDKDVISKKPDWVTISCGVNDVWHGAKGVELDPYKANMTSIVDQCQAAGIKVMLLTATMIKEDQPNSNNQKLTAYNEFLRTLAKEKHCLLADLNALMQAEVKRLNDSASAHGNTLTVDGVHMNAAGNEMMASGVLSAFGLSEAQIKDARGKWDNIPKAVEVGMISVSIRQYKALDAVAAKRNQSVADMVNAAIAKTVDDLLKETR